MKEMMDSHSPWRHREKKERAQKYIWCDTACRNFHPGAMFLLSFLVEGETGKGEREGERGRPTFPITLNRRKWKVLARTELEGGRGEQEEESKSEARVSNQQHVTSLFKPRLHVSQRRRTTPEPPFKDLGTQETTERAGGAPIAKQTRLPSRRAGGR